MSCRATPRDVPVKISLPFSVVLRLGSPRIRTVLTSPLVRPTWTPGTRCKASATVRSGNLPMSSATTESTSCTEFCLFSWADSRLARTPVTTSFSSSTAFSCSAVAVACWARADGRAVRATRTSVEQSAVRFPRGADPDGRDRAGGMELMSGVAGLRFTNHRRRGGRCYWTHALSPAETRQTEGRFLEILPVGNGGGALRPDFYRHRVRAVGA